MIGAKELYHYESAPDRWWSTANASEALPGIVTPLSWSVWGPAIELAMRDTFVRMGALEPEQLIVPANASERAIAIFHGRAALSVSYLCEMGNRLPGSGGDAIAKQLLGFAPPDLPTKRDLSRMHHVAYKMPHALAVIRKRVLAGTAPAAAWWSSWMARIPEAHEATCFEALRDGREQLRILTAIQANGVFIGVQAAYDQLTALIERAGLDPASANALMAGQGSHAETAIIADLWELGRENITLETFLSRHGYHGPAEGQLINHMWREDPAPVLRMAAQYAQRPDSDHPTLRAEQRTRERIEAEQKLLALVPAWQRPVAQGILKMAVLRIPLRGVAKEALIRALDVCRATGRRLGTLYTEQGKLSEPDDALFFTADELLAGLPDNAAEIAAERRAERDRLALLDIPKHWEGTPEATPIDKPIDANAVGTPVVLDGEEIGGDAPAAEEAAPADGPAVTGIGASGGVVEGTVRLVHDPAFTDVEPDEILVCPTTDPSWASILFLCSALVVDIGGPLSHAAVVAREVGIPCVIGTENGTSILRTGDEVRVDGNTGTVEILSRAEGTA